MNGKNCKQNSQKGKGPHKKNRFVTIFKILLKTQIKYAYKTFRNLILFQIFAE